MSNKQETTFKDRIKPLIAALPQTHVEKIQQVAIIGTSDLHVCCNSYFIALELKKDLKSEISKLQIFKLKKVYAAGGVALIVSPETWELIYDRIKSLAYGKPSKESCYSILRSVSRAQLFTINPKTE